MAQLINRHHLRVIDGRLVHRFHDSTATREFRAFVAWEPELGDRAAALLMRPDRSALLTLGPEQPPPPDPEGEQLLVL